MKSKKKNHHRKKAHHDDGIVHIKGIDVKTAEIHTEGTLLLEASSMKKIAVGEFLAIAVSAALMVLIVWLLPLPVWASVAIAAVPTFPLYGKLRKMMMIGAYLLRGKAITIPWALAEEDVLILDGRVIPLSKIQRISFTEGDENRVFSPLAATMETEVESFHFRSLRDGTEEEIAASEDSLNDFLVSMKLLTDVEMEKI